MNLLKTLINLSFPKISTKSDSLDIYTNFSTTFHNTARFKKSEAKNINQIYVGCEYSGDIAILIDRIKIGLEWEIGKELAHQLAIQLWQRSEQFLPTPNIIVPVPADPKRYLERGFHLPTIVSNELAKIIRKDRYKTRTVNALKKSRHTKPQSGLDKKSRKINNKGAYQLNKNIVKSVPRVEHIWLVDDVVATQSTLDQCASLLKEYFPEAQIDAVVLAGN